MDLSWVEFFVIIGCGLAGFFVVNALLDARRRGESARQGNGAGSGRREQAEQSEEEEAPISHDCQRAWWEILGVGKDASSDEIKSAFRREIARYHPDRVQGLGRELRELAEQKAKEINWAYTAAKHERGFSST